MSHERVERFIARLEQIESNHKTTSRRLRTASKATALAGIGIVGVDLFASGSVTQAIGVGAIVALPPAGLTMAGEAFDRVADRAGIKSEDLIDRLSNRYKLRRSRLTVVK